MKHNHSEEIRKFIWAEILISSEKRKLTDEQISNKLGISLSKFHELKEKYKKELFPDWDENPLRGFCN